PKLPAIAADADFSKRATDWSGEEVSAGKGKIDNPTKVADKITMEYGAALIGVEQLAQEGKTPRYTQASTELIVPRKKWILVGPIIRPFDENGKASDMLSGHYYKDQQLPHVWMHEAIMSDDTVSWKNPFPDLNKVVPANKVFAIQIPDMYGTNLMVSAKRYNKYFGTSYNGDAPIDYTFTGRFTNEDALPTYTELTAGQPVLLNNSYPANINVKTLIDEEKGTVQTYNYTKKSFEQVTSGLIIAQHGFVYSSNATSLTIPLEAFEVSNTEHRSIAEYMPEVSITVSNQAAEASSTVHLAIDWLKDDVVNYDTDAPKVFNAQETMLPDLYIMRYNEKWAGVRVPTYDEPIPLGIRVSAADQTFVFSLDSEADMATVMLEDRLEGKTYNLLAGETCTVTGLKVGDCEGRFFLNVGAKEQVEDEVVTDIEDSISDKNINILSKEQRIIVSCNNEVELQTIIVNDMSGRSSVYNVSGQYVELNLPVTQGVYTVKVIGDNATKTGKVILK
ncbi:MAG: T9SS type A sorting domain-containing protein, partial [Paludibacteraceae bacterium]|nr:T9SS type A sorting domain-containing protein [Paludibacteraceae bacterium]